MPARASRRREIRARAVAQRPEHRLGGDAVQRITVAVQDRVELAGPMNRPPRVPAAGVGERLAEASQLASLGIGEREAATEPCGARVQVVAVRGDNRPRPVAAAKVRSTSIAEQTSGAVSIVATGRGCTGTGSA